MAPKPKADEWIGFGYSASQNEYYYSSERDCDQFLRHRTTADREDDELLATGHVGDPRARGVRERRQGRA